MRHHKHYQELVSAVLRYAAGEATPEDISCIYSATEFRDQSLLNTDAAIAARVLAVEVKALQLELIHTKMERDAYHKAAVDLDDRATKAEELSRILSDEATGGA